MPDIQKLEQQVRNRYERKNPNRDRWCDWMYENHVIDVADYAEKLARRFNASPDACRAAALLHDIADAEMPRSNPQNEVENLKIASHLLQEANFNKREMGDILGDGLPFHSCHGDERPKTLIGKILATADALSHLNSDFYGYFNTVLAKEKSRESLRQSAAERLSRDFDKKIAFEEVREEAKERYDELLARYAACLVCDRINQIQKGTNPYIVAEFPSGYAVLGDFQFYHGYTIFLSRIHAIELHELTKKQRLQFLEDMAQVAEGVYRTFKPLKLNYELLGNLDGHMHWHIFPRYVNDPNITNPVSVIAPEIRNAESTRPSKAQLQEMKAKLRKTLQQLGYPTP